MKNLPKTPPLESYPEAPQPDLRRNILKFHFFETHSGSAELFRIEFSHRLRATQSVVAIRGKAEVGFAESPGATATFQWTKAVKAFALLFLRAGLRTKQLTLAKEHLQSGPLLEGSQRSAASSLDYAVAKQTQWLAELFGTDPHQRPLLSRAFSIRNSDRRHPGPVSIGLSSAFWEGCDLRVNLNGAPASAQTLQALTIELEENFREPIVSVDNPPERRPESSPSRSDGKAINQFLAKLVQREFAVSIQARPCFSRSETIARLQAVERTGLYRRIAGKPLSLVLPSPESNDFRMRFGIFQESTAAREMLGSELTVACPATLLGPLMLWFYLQEVKQFGFTLDYAAPHAIQIVSDLVAGRLGYLPDVLCCGIAPAATLAGSLIGKDYVPLMFLPEQPQKVIAPRSLDTTTAGENLFNRVSYSYLNQEPSIPAFLVEELQELGVVNKRLIKSIHHEPDQSFSYLAEGDPESRAVLFFPHYAINTEFNNCIEIPDPRAERNSQEVLVFIHRSKAALPGFARTLELALRDAWFEYRTHPELVTALSDRLTSDQNQFSKYVARYSGLYQRNFPAAHPSAS